MAPGRGHIDLENAAIFVQMGRGREGPNGADESDAPWVAYASTSTTAPDLASEAGSCSPKMMGHSDIETTTIYLSASASMMRAQMAKHPLG